MIEKQTVIDQIEIVRDSAIQLRLGLLLLEDGVTIDCKWHRTRINPGDDLDQQMKEVNAHLVSMGKLPLPDKALDTVRKIIKLIHTPTVVKEYREHVRASMEAQMEQQNIVSLQ